MVRVAPLFLLSPRSAGRLGLALKEFGTTYGTFGTGAFILGNVVGGNFAAGRGLKRSLPWLLGMLNLPMLNFWYLSLALPTSNVPITIAVGVEMFGYGFGSVGVILLIPFVAGEGGWVAKNSQSSHSSARRSGPYSAPRLAHRSALLAMSVTSGASYS